MAERKLVIAIDGPAGAGKSTVAKLIAEHLGYLYIDTGAMYRAITLKAIRRGTPLDDAAELGALTRATQIRLVPGAPGAAAQVFLDGEDVTEEIRTPEVNLAVSPVALHASVRSALVEIQQRMADQGGVVMDGRDIGTVVLPGADRKFFLTASLEERARRRAIELEGKGHTVSVTVVREDVARRDNIDSQRAVAPLRPAPGAILVDTTDKNVAEVVTELLQLIKGDPL